MRAVLIVSVVLWAAPVLAKPAPSLPRKLAACATLIDNFRRLTCYDVLASGTRRSWVRTASAHDYQPRFAPAGSRKTCFLFNGERVCE